MQIKFKNKLEYLKTLNDVLIRQDCSCEITTHNRYGFTIIDVENNPKYPKCVIRISTESAETVQHRFEENLNEEFPSYYFYQYPINDKLTYYLWVEDRQNNPSQYGINCNEVDLLHHSDHVFVNYYPQFFIQNTKLQTDLPSMIKLDQVDCDNLDFRNLDPVDVNYSRIEYSHRIHSQYSLIAIEYRRESFPESIKEHLLKQDDIRQTLENIK